MVTDLLNSLADATVDTPTAGTLRIERNSPVRADNLVFDEAVLNDMPQELRDVLKWSDGLEFFGVTILSRDELYCTEDKEIVFHDWGTGDVTALRPSDGHIIYRGHGRCDGVVVATSLEEWFALVYKEVMATGVLWHPEDSDNMHITTMYNANAGDSSRS